jgi:ATP-dependent helicase/nuclease subunit A
VSTATREPIDQRARTAIVEDLDRNLCVEAGAGTGKTSSLVARIVALLESGTATVDQLVVMTFTEKAAAELSARVREQLEQRLEGAGEPAAAERIRDAVRDLHRAHIETIHAFAASLLRERPIEAGLDPQF